MNQDEKSQREQHWKNFKDNFLDYDNSSQQNEIDYFVEKVKKIEEFSLESKRTFLLFDYKKFFPVYISRNAEIESGYTNEFLSKQNLFFIFKILHWTQLSIPAKISTWGNKYHKKYGHLYKPNNVKVHFCGIKLKDKWGKWRTLIFSQRLLTFSENHKPLLSYIEAEEITVFHQSNVFWYRIEIEADNGPITKVFYTNTSKKEAAELLSKRELEILKLIAQHKNNIEIAKHLSITKNTVERHRKNMLAKTGVINMTGLLRIAQIVNLI